MSKERVTGKRAVVLARHGSSCLDAAQYLFYITSFDPSALRALILHCKFSFHVNLSPSAKYLPLS